MASKEFEKQLQKEFARAHREINIKKDIVLEVKHLNMYFPINTGFFIVKYLKAVDDVSFSVKRGETIGLVGESGCGKRHLEERFYNCTNDWWQNRFQWSKS